MAKDVLFESMGDEPFTVAELSLVWGGTSVGDAHLAPYNYMWFMAYITLMARLTSTTKYGVLETDHDSYNAGLAPTNPAGTTLRVRKGAAVVRRVVYLSDDNVDFSCSQAGYYTLVLRFDADGQTIRQYLLGHSPNGYPSPVRQGTIWDQVLAYVYSNGATLTITDMRRFIRNLIAYTHDGETYHWYIPNIGKYVRGMMMEVGSATPENLGASTAAFARKYPLATTPLVFFQTVGGGNPPDATLLVNTTTNRDTVDYYIDSINGASAIWWMSFGMLG